MSKSKRSTHSESNATSYQSKLAILNELASCYPVGEKRIVHMISGLAPRISYMYSCCDDKDLLPLWKLKLITCKLIKLHLELAVPNCINKTDIIDINCAVLGKEYTKCTCNYVTDFGISPCTTQRKMNKLTFDFEFRIDDTCYYEQNQHSDGMEQADDSKWINFMKSDQIKFVLTFELDILRFKGDLADEAYFYGNSYRDCNNNSLRWFDFHFGDFNKLLDEIHIDSINNYNKNQIMPFTISYCCKDVLTKNIENTRCIIDILRKKYNYGLFANVFYDLLNQYLYSSSRKHRSRHGINNINNNNKNSRINKRNKCIEYNFKNTEDTWTKRECCQKINELCYFDVCCASFNNPNVLHNTWKRYQDDEYLYLLSKGRYTKRHHQWFLNSRALHNIICLKKIVYDECASTGALSEYAYGSPYYFNHDYCDDDAHGDCGNSSDSASACNQESTTGISDERHCQHTGQHIGQDNPSDMYFVYQRHMDDYDDDHVTTKVEIKNYHKKRRYYRFHHVKTDCKQRRKEKKIKTKRKKEKKNKTLFELHKWMNGGF